MSQAEIPAEGERWVMCPVCGSKIMNEWVAACNRPCDVCGSMITICATRRFVATIVHEKNERATTSERIRRFKEELELLVQ